MIRHCRNWEPRAVFSQSAGFLIRRPDLAATTIHEHTDQGKEVSNPNSNVQLSAESDGSSLPSEGDTADTDTAVIKLADLSTAAADDDEVVDELEEDSRPARTLSIAGDYRVIPPTVPTPDRTGSE